MIDDPDAERWAEALAVEKLHGERAVTFIVERIGALAVAGDLAGVDRCTAIATRIDMLHEGTVQ